MCTWYIRRWERYGEKSKKNVGCWAREWNVGQGRVGLFEMQHLRKT